MKRQYKYISFILALFALLSLLIPSDLIAIDVGSNGINESYVSAIDIKETITGLAPFDKDNAAGNDSGPNNNIVRSFDNINYTLEYITDLKTNTPITEAYLMVEFTLPYPKEIATFDMGSMVWMKDPVLTVKNGVQTLTGKRHLQNTADSSAIPGQGTLSIGIKVQAATHGSKIQPTFKLWKIGRAHV